MFEWEVLNKNGPQKDAHQKVDQKAETPIV